MDDRDDQIEETPARTSGKAIFSLLLGIFSFCIPLAIPSLLAIVLGGWSLRDIGVSQGKVKGKGLAIGGMIAGFLSMLFSCVFLGFIGTLLIAGPAYTPGISQIVRTTEKAKQRNNMREVELALQNYNDIHGQLPPSVVYDSTGRPLYSWRVLILPYLERENTFKAFRMDEAWDSPHNITLLSQMPPAYMPPASVKTKEPHSTFMMVPDGPLGAFDSGAPEKRSRPSTIGLRPWGAGIGKAQTFVSTNTTKIPSGFQDGMSNTILLIDGAEAVPWTKPEDVYFDAKYGPIKVGGMFSGECCVMMADGTFRTFRKGALTDTELRQLMTARGGELTDMSKLR